MFVPIPGSQCCRGILPSLFVALLLVAVDTGHAAEQSWTFLPIQDVGARRFLTDHPTYDGRGVVIAVLDTGVDMSIPGLDETSEGMIKVIDVRDFTGEGHIDLKEAEWADGAEGKTLVAEDGLWLSGFDHLAIAPADPEQIWTGVLNEERFANAAGLQDLDDNGSEHDRWGLVVYAASREDVIRQQGEGRGVVLRRQWGEKAQETEDEIARNKTVWLCVFDRDRDGDLSDETILRDYATDYQSFTLRDVQREEAKDVLGIALDLRGDDEPQLNLHYDDGGHGSHVSGIAAGFGVHGQEGLNGVAPGAWLISCKLGDNTLSGGSTRTESMKKAYEYVASLVERYEVPVVINMSFGIGSEVEGDATMETWLDELLDEHSKLVICQSAGNSGPGLSTVGLPSAADGVISSAALLTKEVARDLYGGAFERDELFGFSSRGGELAKPDIATPGVASSTVPLWGTSDRYNGTSMASPETAGSVACLISGLLQNGKDWNFGTIKRALQATANPLAGYSRIEAGSGVLNLPEAFSAAVAYADAGEAGKISIYTVRTTSAFQPDGKAPAAYWRTGGWFPRHPRQQSFSIRPRFAKEMSADQRNKFYRAFRLKSDVDWIRIDRKQTYINGDSERNIDLSYDPARLTEPGVYVGTVKGLAKGTERSGAAAYEFELVVTIVIPHVFGDGVGYEKEWKGRKLAPGQFAREFVRVPEGASSMVVTVEIPRGRKGRILTILHDPAGRRVGRLDYASDEEERMRQIVISGEDLLTGIWEIDNRASFDPTGQSVYDLRVAFEGFAVEPDVLRDLDFSDPGQAPTLEAGITALFDEPFRGRATGEIDHYRRERNIEVEKSVYSMDFEVSGGIDQVAFTVAVDETTYNRFTDCAVNIYDGEGNYVVQSGLGQKSETVTLREAQPGKYKLEVVAAFARAEDAESWGFDLTERYRLADPVRLQGSLHDSADIVLYPDAGATLILKADATPPMAPEGFVDAGEMRLIDAAEGQVRLRVPIRLGEAASD